MLIDTHSHLNFKAFNKDLDEVILRAKEAGVDKIIIPGAKINSSKKAVEISQKYEVCFAAVGIHPHHVADFIELGKRETTNQLKILANNKKAAAIGEIGLDYHEYKGYLPVNDEIKTRQKELLLTQIEIATELNMPVIFHCRDAHDDQLELIGRLADLTRKKIRGVFHCFGGEIKHLKKLLSWDFYVGFDGNISYPENENLRMLVKATPIDKLLLETDSPFLTPVPFRGQRNEPANLIRVAKTVSEIHKITLEDVAAVTSGNALKLFRV